MIEEELNKDELYYSDLDYTIRKRMGMAVSLNSKTERRIHERMHSVSKRHNGIEVHEFSPFALDVFAIFDRVKKEVGVSDISFKNLTIFHKSVQNVLNEINNNGISKIKK